MSFIGQDVPGYMSRELAEGVEIDRIGDDDYEEARVPF